MPPATLPVCPPHFLVIEQHDAAQVLACPEVGISAVDFIEAIAARDQFAQLQIAGAVEREQFRDLQRRAGKAIDPRP